MVGFFLTNFNKFIPYRSSQSPNMGEKSNTFAEYFCHTIMKSIIMKKLFTISWRNNVRTCHDCLSHEQGVSVNSMLSQNNTLGLASGNDSEKGISTQLFSINFFVHSATYRKENPLLLTYSAETTQTYKQTLAAPFNFSASSFLRKRPEYIIMGSGINGFNTCSFTTDSFPEKNDVEADEYGDLYLK